MGVQISSLVKKNELEMQSLAGKKVAIDAYNTIYQFLSIIRDHFTGEPLRDSEGRVTSHLSGLMYRFSNVVQAGVKPVMVFDGKPPEFKWQTTQKRADIKKEAQKKWEDAKARGETGIKYAQATSKITPEILESSKELLGYMGVPVVQAPSEGEALCSFLCQEKVVDYAASQDYDALLFGAPKLIRNLSMSGKKKLPGKQQWIEVKPEMLELSEVLRELGINREQLIMMGMLIGTDYNSGVKGIGPKTALKVVKEHKTLDNVLKNVQWTDDIDPQKVFDWFIDPPKGDIPKIEWKSPQPDKIMHFLLDEHGFSRERVEKIISRLEETKKKGAQSSLSGWLKK